VSSGFLSPSPGTTGICCLIDSLSPRRTSTPPPSSRNTPSSPTPPSPQHPPASNFIESRARACTALLITAVTVIIGPVTLTTFFSVVCTLRRCHGPHGRAAFLGSSMLTCARFVNTTSVIQGSVWNPRPNHRTQWLQMGVKLLTNSGHGFAPGTSTAGTVRLAQVQCLVCVHGLSVVAAHTLRPVCSMSTHGNRAWGAKASSQGIMCFAAQRSVPARGLPGPRDTRRGGAGPK
jgi:hypothetical protein